LAAMGMNIEGTNALRPGAARASAPLVRLGSLRQDHSSLSQGRGVLPLTFYPDPGSIVICDFSTGFQPPEMVEVRPVVVISPRRRRGRLVTIVPLSSTQSNPIEPWHYEIPKGVYPPARGRMWAKCDMVETVALDRLDRVRTRDPSGRRAYVIFQLEAEHLEAIRAAVRAALGFS